MYGDDVGSLTVYKNRGLLWRKKGNHGDQWLDAYVSTGCSQTMYEVRLLLISVLLS